MESIFNTLNDNDDSDGEYLEILGEIEKSNQPEYPELSIFEQSRTINQTKQRANPIKIQNSQQQQNITVWEDEFSLINNSTKLKTEIMEEFKPPEPLANNILNALKTKIILILEEKNEFVNQLVKQENINKIVELLKKYLEKNANKFIEISDKSSKLKNPFFLLNFTDVTIHLKMKKNQYLQYIAEYISEQFQKNEISIQNLIWERKKRIVCQLRDSPIKINIFNINKPQEDFLWYWHEVLITEYSKIDPRFFILGSFLIYWAKQREILNDQYLTINNLLYLLIFFLQIQSPPILPPIQALDKELLNQEPKFLKTIAIPTILKSYTKDKNLFHEESNEKGQNPSWKEQHLEERKIEICIFSGEQAQEYLQMKNWFNDISVGILLAQFFYIFGFWIPKFKMQMSILQGRFLFSDKYDSGFILMNPFEETNSLTRHLTQSKVDRQKQTVVNDKYIHLLQEFSRSYDLISEKKFDKITDPYQ